ncbi:uncharacterized protein LOC106155538 isoform X3 [Lingula anatina]|uniref:Uncharacterized protein LOC106155538 isoform X3 n=1 Tax=Lingula anatina TaxID=7574 RepID=A0A2R2MRN8_LINAN|nr:uncharacterized protein LOC106155538 isoform X3 [Lingula anatina]|eukprot:XP_023932916.1 uncharacterized protein LOC106155538 isoform X3 [Lingula anatina]
MPHICVAPGCRNRGNEKKGINFFSLPVETAKRQIWINALKLKNPSAVDNYKYARICSDHFEPECFVRNLRAELCSHGKTRRKLRDDAVPSIFDFSEYKNATVNARALPTRLVSGKSAQEMAAERKERFNSRAQKQLIAEQMDKMRHCMAYGCKNTTENSDVAYYTIPNPKINPKEKERAEAWLKNMGINHDIGAFRFNKQQVVCSDHFEGHCFEGSSNADFRGGGHSGKLKPDAVPTIAVPKTEKSGDGSEESEEKRRHRKELYDLLEGKPVPSTSIWAMYQEKEVTKAPVIKADPEVEVKQRSDGVWHVGDLPSSSIQGDPSADQRGLCLKTEPCDMGADTATDPGLPSNMETDPLFTEGQHESTQASTKAGEQHFPLESTSKKNIHFCKGQMKSIINTSTWVPNTQKTSHYFGKGDMFVNGGQQGSMQPSFKYFPITLLTPLSQYIGKDLIFIVSRGQETLMPASSSAKCSATTQITSQDGGKGDAVLLTSSSRGEQELLQTSIKPKKRQKGLQCKHTKPKVKAVVPTGGPWKLKEAIVKVEKINIDHQMFVNDKYNVEIDTSFQDALLKEYGVTLNVDDSEDVVTNAPQSFSWDEEMLSSDEDDDGGDQDDDTYVPSDASLLSDDDGDDNNDYDDDKGCSSHQTVKVKDFQCHICNQLFSSKKSLIGHKRVHSVRRDGPYKCQYCSKGFANKHRCSNHEMLHTSEKNYLCQYCSKTFKTAQYCSRHEKEHSKPKKKERFACQFCDRRFFNANARNLHEKKHLGAKEFQCQFCSKMFHVKNHLINHERVHTGEKPYQCRYCDKTFIQAIGRSCHERVHTGEKPYKCSFCDEAFNHNVSRKAHEKKHHNKE